MPPPGQGLPGGVLDGPNVEQRLTNVLGLTAEQQNKVHTALDERRVLAQGQTSKVPDLRDQLAAAVRANDEGKIDQLTQELSRAQQQQLSLQAKTMAKIYAALTADQKSRFDASLDRQMGVRPRQGKGAPPPGAIR